MSMGDNHRGRGHWLWRAGLLAGWLGVLAPATAAWLDDKGQPLPERPFMRSSGDFGVQLVLTPDAAAFVKTWNAAKTQAPRLAVTGTVRRGEAVSAMLVFSGCTPAASGACDVAVAYSLTTPSGQVLQTGSGAVWQDRLPAARLQLGKRSATLRFEAQDTPGVYKVGALVTDKVSGRRLALEAPLTVE